MTDNNKLNTTQPKPQMQQTDYTQAQNLNDKEFDSMFDVLETSSMSTDEEDYIESPPRKISRTVCQQSSLEGLATFSIRNSNNIATSTENCAVVAATSTTTSTSNNANMEVDDGTANLLKSGYSSSNASSSSQNGNDIQQQQCDLKESPTQYSRSSTTTDTSSSCLLDMTPPEHALAMLKMEDMLLYIKDRVTVIGRNSTTSNVDFHVASSSFVSRKHFQIDFDPECGEFFLTCGSKNGIFVDDELQRCNAPPTKLPKSCIFRFPSTELLIHFENYVYKNLSRRQMDCDIFVPLRSESTPIETIDAMPDSNLITGDAIPCCSSATTSTTTEDTVKLTERINNQSTEVYSTLKISIPNLEAHSNPYPSPTGTISAANSCPASPRHSFPDYQTFCANGNRNNLNNDDAFRTPSTCSHNEIEKPPYSYAQLIIQSISSAPEKQLTLSGIYTFISKNYPYYRMEANKGWQNSIRHNLSLNRYFIKVPRSQDEPGKGSFWRIDPNSEAKLINSSYKTRRQRSVVNFKRPLIDKPHSAPVSPSPRDMSRENSPLQDLTLQSAPGSPEILMIKEEELYDVPESTEEVETTCEVETTDDQYN